MEAMIRAIVKAFVKASRGSEDMPEKNYQKLVTDQLKNLMAETDSADAVKEVREDMGETQEGKVSFTEFMNLLGYLATKLSDKHQAGKGTAPEPCKLITPSSSRMSGPLIGNSSGSESNLENAMQLMIQTFHKYSGNEGDKYTLSRGELKDMLTQELGNYLGNPQDKDAVDKVMGDLDANNDGEVDFTEFVILVGALTVACNDFFLEYNQKIEKKQ
ncbi:hypothetical protein COCON_G00005910 [Conger conger]|uniref:EF-hand domain-containing protein n=2 Tax=Conger conger TaxID=82655 RepID=A0A9Q1E1I2_CONCO|nr:hypothetical protein COCON_G00005910 [Conger conger]